MKLSAKGEDKIGRIPGDDGWWKTDSADDFEKMAQELIDKGFLEEDAIDFLAHAYSIVSGEYGN